MSFHPRKLFSNPAYNKTPKYQSKPSNPKQKNSIKPMLGRSKHTKSPNHCNPSQTIGDQKGGAQKFLPFHRTFKALMCIQIQRIAIDSRTNRMVNFHRDL